MAERRRVPFRQYRERARRALGGGGWMALPVLLAAAAYLILDSLGARAEEAGRAGRAEKAGPDSDGEREGPRQVSPTGLHEPSDESLVVGHEVAEVKPSLVLWLAVVLLAGIGVLLVGLWFLQGTLAERSTSLALRPGALPQAGDAAFTDLFRVRAPGLFPDPELDLRGFLSAQEEQRVGYGWADRRAGVATLPLERAMSLIAEQGLPAWDFPGTAGDTGNAGTPPAPAAPREADPAGAGGAGNAEPAGSGEASPGGVGGAE